MTTCADERQRATPEVFAKPILASAKTAAEMLDVSLSTFHRNVAPKLNRVTLGKSVRYRVSELEALR